MSKKGVVSVNAVIYNPLEEFAQRLKPLHGEKTKAFFQDLVQRSGVHAEENRKTVAEYRACLENGAQLKKQRNLLRFLRVLMCITLVLIPVVIRKTTPRIRALKEQMDTMEQRAEKLLREAEQQMAPLNRLFTDKDALRIAEAAVPLLQFAPCFTIEQETDMRLNYDLTGESDAEQSTLEVLAGHYNGNPFFFENRLLHTMGTEVYHGYKTIHWTETYRDSKGNLRTEHHSQTLHATVEKPKPFYRTQVVLHYGAQGAPELSFSRDATHLHRKSDKAIERYVKRGERRLKRKTDKAIRNNDDFVSMSNTDFEVLFDALDRTNEVQFRSLFTPLAQTNMVDLLLSDTGFGDDFDFVKRKRMNRIVSQHSQGRDLLLRPEQYTSYDFDAIQANFLTANETFFKAVYFDLAPILSIPAYQERPVHSLKPIPDYTQLYSLKEGEALANAANRRYMVHPDTKTEAILKSSFVRSASGADETAITAYSYDIAPRVDYVTMMGGDGRLHSVMVPWDEYLPLTACNHFYITAKENATNKKIMASRNGLCICN